MLHKLYRTSTRFLLVFLAVMVSVSTVSILENVSVDAASCVSDSRRTINNSGCQPQNNNAAAQAKANAMCNRGAYVGFGAYADNVANLNYNGNGTADLKIHLVLRKCTNNDRTKTRHFAITGYKSGSFTTCPIAGSYAGGTLAAPATRDCVKYVGTYNSSQREPLNCDYSSTDHRQKHNSDCFTAYGKSNVRREGSDKHEPSSNINANSVNAVVTQALKVPNWTRTRDSQTQYTFSSDSAFCEYYKTNIGNGNFNNDRDVKSNAWCQSLSVTAKWDQPYNLQPQASVSPEFTQAGSDVFARGSVQNTKKYSAGEHDWQVNAIKFDPGKRLSDNAGKSTDETANPCSRYNSRSDGYSCPRIWYADSGHNSAKTSFDNGKSQDSGNITFSIPPDDPVGTQYCFVTSVEKPTQSDGGKWAHSDAVCILVGITPRVQTWGYDTKVGGTIQTSTTQYRGNASSPNIYGSWGEYGVFSGGFNRFFASGSGLVNGGSSSQGDWSDVTFANYGTTCSGGYGCYGSIPYPSATVASLIEQLCSGNMRNENDPITSSETSGTKPICVDGTAKITGNQDYSSKAKTSDSKIPQRIIIAKDIDIDDSVTNIDAWLIATGATSENPTNLRGGTISTCSDAVSATGAFSSAKLDSKTCSKKLTVHGPVITGKMYLLRTYTGQSKPVDPAELFDLRADSFLWSYQGSSNSSDAVAETNAVQELPPRF